MRWFLPLLLLWLAIPALPAAGFEPVPAVAGSAYEEPRAAVPATFWRFRSGRPDQLPCCLLPPPFRLDLPLPGAGFERVPAVFAMVRLSASPFDGRAPPR